MDKKDVERGRQERGVGVGEKVYCGTGYRGTRNGYRRRLDGRYVEHNI